MITPCSVQGKALCIHYDMTFHLIVTKPIKEQVKVSILPWEIKKTNVT